MSPPEQCRSVLVVDDDESICELMTLILSDEGYAVRLARSADQAIQLIQEQQPALILLDLSLPGRSGADFMSAYRCLPNATAPIIVVSGLPNVVQLGAQIGAAGSLPKPFDVTVLLDTVHEALSVRGESERS